MVYPGSFKVPETQPDSIDCGDSTSGGLFRPYKNNNGCSSVFLFVYMRICIAKLSSIRCRPRVAYPLFLGPSTGCPLQLHRVPRFSHPQQSSIQEQPCFRVLDDPLQPFM
jgi:hypothetical protein